MDKTDYLRCRTCGMSEAGHVPGHPYDEIDTTPRWITEANVTRKGMPPEDCYPKNGTHTWGAFACLAIEMGGYGDFEIVDPYTGRRFWTPAFGNNDENDNPTIYDALRRAIDAMEAHAFLTTPTTEEGK